MALSIYKDTFFGSTRLPANKVLLIAYLWLTKSLHTAMITQVGVNANTITNWTNSLRGLVTWDIENLDLADECLQFRCKIEVLTPYERLFKSMYSLVLLYEGIICTCPE